ncbi:MAG: hypothetical protein PHP44_05870 [Kiritimatiellae bacterium]|nr:hypothetical protein [Kiritimatiellia bacterium]MDD4735616.1 hypothetical protein [Kiritimatiellia bacterium]
MPDAFAERDWKYMKSIHDELLSVLCERINRECRAIIASREGTAHARYLRLYKHIHKADDIVGDCFNDLKRSNLGLKMCNMNRQGLLKPEHLEQLTPATQEFIKSMK